MVKVHKKSDIFFSKMQESAIGWKIFIAKRRLCVYNSIIQRSVSGHPFSVMSAGPGVVTGRWVGYGGFFRSTWPKVMP